MSARIAVQDNPAYGSNFKLIDFSVPGIMTYALFIVTVQLTIVSFVSEKMSGTLYRLLASPLRESEIVFGYGFVFSIIGTMQSVLLVVVAIAVFHISIVGNILIVLGVIVLLAIVSQALGIVSQAPRSACSNLVRSRPYSSSGFFAMRNCVAARRNTPLAKSGINLLPSTCAVDAIRSVMLRWWGLDKIWFDVLMLFIFGVVFLSLATWFLKHNRE